VRVIVISGAGSDFCSGADLVSLQKIADGSVAENADDARSLMDLFALMRQIQIPIVAAVRRQGVGGRMWIGECLRHSAGFSRRAVWLSRSEDRFRPGDGDGDSAT